MGIKFWEWLAGGKARAPTTVEVSCRELLAAAQEFQLRDLCFWACANMIANAVGRCEFRTFRGGVDLATWNSDGYSYSLSLSFPLDISGWQTVIESII